MLTQTNRREFLQTTVAVSLAAAMGRTAEAPRVPIVDTHLHCFAGKDDARFPYHEKAPYRPPETATPQHLLRCMDGAGVDHAIVVHPEPYQDDHRYLEYCLQVGKGRLKGTCLFFADRPSWKEQLPALVKNGGIVALRIHAYVAERLPPFGKPELRDLWKAAADLGLAVQLHFEPKHAPGFEPLIKEFADTRVIIDHLGRPLQGTKDEYDVVVGWSRLPNTVMKLSSIQRAENPPERDLSPIIKRLVKAYGPDRLIYGGGYGATATPENYRAARAHVQSFLTDLSGADQAKVLGGTAVRLFGFRAK